MDISLNDLFHLSLDEINNSKIELNQQAGRNGEPFIDRYLKYSRQEKEGGTCKNCSYWGWYGEKTNYKIGQLAFSFIRMQDKDEWLFVSAARIVSIPENDFAKVEILDKFKSLFGRVIIKYKKGNTFSRYVFNLNNLINDIVVKEILPSIYDGEKFEGYDKVHLPFKKLADIFNGKILPTYAANIGLILQSCFLK